MENFEESIKMYKAQLQAINSTIEASGESEDLQDLKQNIEQLIELTTQSLLEQKKQELLNEVDSAVITDHKKIVKEENKPNNFSDELDKLIGTKCRAPFKSLCFHKKSYHNAVIFSYEESSLNSAKSLQDISVRIVFCMPTENKMIPCQFFLDGKCKFSDEKCRYSHGKDFHKSAILLRKFS